MKVKKVYVKGAKKSSIKIENEVEILKMINKYGVLEKRVLHLFFGNGKSPYVFNRRIAKMDELNLVTTNRLYCWIAANGERALNEVGIEKNYSSVFAKRVKLAKESKLLSMFPNRFILSRIEYLKNFQLMEDIGYARMFAGVIWNDKEEKELVYLVNDENLKYIDNYVNLDSKVAGINNVVLAVDNINQLINIKDKTPLIKVNSAIVVSKDEYGILIYDLIKKGYINNKYLYEFLRVSTEGIKLKLEGENLFINDMKLINFLEFDLKNIYKKTERIVINNESGIIFGHFDFYEDCFTEDTPFFSNKNMEYGNLSIDMNDYIEFLEREYGYIKCSFKSIGARLPYSDLFFE